MKQNQKYKVCILSSVHSAFDIRVFYKEAKTLAQAGYDVTLIAQHNKDEIVDGVKIIALPKPKNRFVRIFGLTCWALYLALRQHADVYHFHDPELIFIGILLKLLGKKVIYDVHEDLPKDILYKDWLGNVFIREILSFIFNLIEKIGSFFFDKIITVTPDIAKKFPKNKVVILRNLPILDLIDSIGEAKYKKNKPIIIYAGGIGKTRGIKNIIQAMEYIGDRAVFYLLGKWSNEKYKKECEKLRGWKYTKYLGFKKLEEVYSTMKSSDIAIVNFLPGKHNLKAQPNKLFECMACSLPVVMSNFTYWKKMFGKCVLFVNPHDPKDIANKILFLLDNPDKAKILAYRGREMIKKNYNWETESKKVLEIYKNVY